MISWMYCGIMLVDFVLRSDDLDSDVDDEDNHGAVVIGLQYKYNTFFLTCKIKVKKVS